LRSPHSSTRLSLTRGAHRHGARSDRQLALTRAAVAHHQPLAVLIELIDQRRHVLLDLGLQRRGDHPARTLAREIVQREAGLVGLPDGEPANIHHGVPSCRPTPASVFINREGTPPSFSSPSTTSGYSSRAGRLSEVKTAKGASVLSDINVTRDAVGNPLSTVQTGATSATTINTYDALDRAAGVCYQASPCTSSTSPFIRWTYDPVGNRKTEARPTGTTTSTYDVDDELLTAGPTTYGYDPNGNQTKAGKTTNTYDGLHRLASTTSSKTTTTFVSDADGLRVKAYTGAQAANTTNYLWDPVGSVAQIALESDGAQQPLRSYTYGPNRLSMNTYGSATGTYYYHYDQLGSAINLTSSTGATQWTNAYEPFGALRSQTKNANKAPANSMLFTGENLDTTGLYNLRAREYDPQIGRFLAVDPIAPPLMNPAVSAYAYVGNRPTVLTDPNGTCGSIPLVPCPSDIVDTVGDGVRAVGHAITIRQTFRSAFVRRFRLPSYMSTGTLTGASS
jgi:RHS repeat-associated protein